MKCKRGMATLHTATAKIMELSSIVFSNLLENAMLSTSTFPSVLFPDPLINDTDCSDIRVA